MDKKDRQIAYVAKSEPLLHENQYIFRARQNIEVRDKDQIRGQDQLEETFPFEVSYRRFRLKPEEIHSMYPPSHAVGDYVNHIPQLTLMEDTIPWEQELTVGTHELPGMFLLVLKKEEGAIKRLLLPKDWEKGDIYLGETLKKQCREYKGNQGESCLDIPAGLLKKLLPEPGDLPFMAHVRWVKVEDKETRLFVTQGHYSSLIANRAPVREEKDISYEVYAVGTLGLWEYYRGEKKEFDGKQMVRLGLFYSWGFTSSSKNAESGSGFKEILDNLDIGYFGNSPGTEITEEIRQFPSLEKLLGSGYRPFNTQLRNGDKTVSWYKSPLSPVRLRTTGREDGLYGRCLSHADAGMAFLPELGMYDATDSAAWTLGRLLAMKNQPFLTALFELRQRHHEKEKETWNIHLIQELLYEGERNDTEFDPLVSPVRQECSRLIINAIDQGPKVWNSRAMELSSMERIINEEGNQ